MEEKTPWIGECFKQYSKGNYDLDKIFDVEEIGEALDQLLDFRDNAKERDEPLGAQFKKEIGYCRSAARCSSSPLFPYLLNEAEKLPDNVIQHALFLLFTWHMQKSKAGKGPVPGPYLSEEDLRSMERHAQVLGDENDVQKEVRNMIREALYAWKKIKKRLPLQQEKEIAQKRGTFIAKD